MVSTPLPAPCSERHRGRGTEGANASAPTGCKEERRARFAAVHVSQQTKLQQAPGDLRRPHQRASQQRSRHVHTAAGQQRGQCAAMAVLMNQVMANTSASSQAVLRGGGARAGAAMAAAVPAATGGCTRRSRWGSYLFNGKPTTRCRPLQTQQAPRQPSHPSSSADTGHPTVLAKPAIKVIPVIMRRASPR